MDAENRARNPEEGDSKGETTNKTWTRNGKKKLRKDVREKEIRCDRSRKERSKRKKNKKKKGEDMAGRKMTQDITRRNRAREGGKKRRKRR